FGSSGQFETLRGLDPELALVSPTSLSFPIAVTLRVDWRVVYAQQTGAQALAAEALDILDDLLASYWNLDLYLLRAGAAYLAEEPHAFMESVATANRQVHARIRSLTAEGERFPELEGQALKQRLSNMKSQLASFTADDERQRAQEISAEIDAVLQRL
ncbi:MAG: hypothetical protein HRU11_13385, partial [Parvularculaceae bacterium]|nr:hypothetical protein [Parvularculaceae bacterium]